MKYHLARGEETLGTFNDLDVSSGLRDGRFLVSDLCWTEGMKDWQTLGERMKEVDYETGDGEPPALTALRAEVRQDERLPLEMAGLGTRLGAKVIDWVLLLVPFFMMLSILREPAFEEEIRKLQNDPAAVFEAFQRQIEKVQASAGGGVLMFMGLLMDAAILTNIILLTVRGQTIGKLALGIHIVRHPSGARAGFVKAVLLRGLVFVILGLFGLFGLLVLMADVLMIFRKDRRCLHDLLADTQVVKR